ncbi:MAG TPA: hypothetical protein VKQ29_01275 [Aliidongia sp.]|nr:hypothetical protein [Aliidongia sp.]
MLARARGLPGFLLILFIVSTPVVTHAVLTAGEWGASADLLVAGQTALALWFVLTRLRRPWRELAAVGLVACCLALCLLHVRGGLVLSTGLPHAMVYTGLLLLFGLSLRPGHVPLVTLLSHQVHGALPPAIDRYTRRVTWAWCLFCLFQLLVSALLIAFAPVAWWSVFVNVLNAPLLAVMLLGEKLTRSCWVENPPRERLGDMMHMVALVRAQLAKRNLGYPRPRES